ncbi:DctM-like transporters [Anaplasma phagocytophilum]|nr:DctM-like transporters [Anaplasma phagocytophilum]SCV64619.1 DctM-like transporters [Anaplasma phagocytophilum]
MGMMSGSSVANTITVGSFTIPPMKKMGITPEKAAAIEVSAGINGQITPPVMGAAAFLMAEFLALSYSSIVKHAFVPALMVYIGLLVIVHFEARRLEGSTPGVGIRGVILRLLITSVSVILLFGFVHIIIDGVTIGCNKLYARV